MLLKDYVPHFLLESREFNINYEVQQQELDAYNNSINDLLNQCFIETATWGLSYWEEFLGVKTDELKSYEYRRSVIKAKLRGQGVITKAMIKNVAESYSNGEVDVTENIAPYTFEVKFIGSRGIPPNLDDLKSSINEIKPAHLAVTYAFTWLTWDEFDNYNKTWDEWDALNLTWDEFETYREVI